MRLNPVFVDANEESEDWLVGDTCEVLVPEYKSFISSGWLVTVLCSSLVVVEPAVEEAPSTLKVVEGSAEVLAPKPSAKLAGGPMGVKVEAYGDSLGASRKLCVVKLAVEVVVNGSELENTEELCPPPF